MKKRAFKIFATILILIIVLFIGLNLTIDGIVKSNIEESGTELFQTEVTVGGVSLSLFSGSGTISDFIISNPEQFSDQDAITMNEIFIELDLMSLLSDTIFVEKVHITAASLLFEQEGFGVNLNQLNENMSMAEDTEETAMVIDSLVVENATVMVSSDIDRERTAEATLDNFTLTGIGRENSTTMNQSMKQIMEPLINRAIREAASEGLLQQLRNRIQDLFRDDEE